MTIYRLNRLLIAAIAAITIIGAVVWDVYTPYTEDDFFYREVIRPDFNPASQTWPGGNEDIATLPQAWESIKNHTVYNGRLANFLHILMQPAGHTAESVLLGLCIGALFVLLCMCIRSFSGKMTVAGIIAATLSFWIILPWHDSFQSMDFQCNYVLPSLAMVGLILLLSKTGKADIKWSSKALILLLAFLCAWLHEGFGCVALAYFITVSIYPPSSHYKKSAILISIAIVIGILVNLICGTSNRIANAEDTGSFTVQILVQVGQELWPFVLSSVLVIFVLFRKKGAERRKIASIYIPLFTGSIAGFCLSLVFKTGDRMLWPCNIFCIIIICSIFNNISYHINKKYQIALSLVFLPLYCWWITQQCIWNKWIGDESRIIEQTHELNRGLTPTVFYLNHIPATAVPYWLVSLTQQPLDKGWNSECFGTYLSGRCGSVMVLPPTLEGMGFESWPEIPGNNRLRGVYPMMAARDSTDLRLIINFGEEGDNISPMTKLLMLIKNRGIKNKDFAKVKTTARRVILPDSSIVFRYCPEPLPRTVEGRRFVSIDIEEDYSPDERSSR